MWARKGFLFLSARLSKSALFLRNSITLILMLAKAKNSFTLILFWLLASFLVLFQKVMFTRLRSSFLFLLAANIVICKMFSKFLCTLFKLLINCVTYKSLSYNSYHKLIKEFWYSFIWIILIFKLPSSKLPVSPLCCII